MTAWHKSALLCALLLILGASIVGCSRTETAAVPSSAASTQVTKNKTGGGGGGGATPDLNDTGAPAGAKAGDYSGGLGKKH